MEKPTMTLWTRQVPQVWQMIQDEGVYFCREAYIREKNDTIADYYLELYRWFTREAGNYFAVPPGTPLSRFPFFKIFKFLIDNNRA